jgi:hypothetical protein
MPNLAMVIVAPLTTMLPAVCLAQERESRVPLDGGMMERPDDTSMKMDKMAEAMTSMAEMCQTMMRGEMKMMPWKIGAAVIIDSILAIALVLFVVLEIQWIRFWSLRIKSEQAAQSSSGMREQTV